jgi:hypothetical protein
VPEIATNAATNEYVCALAIQLPRTTESTKGDLVKFRVGRIVYLTLSLDSRDLGFAFPKDERDGLVASDPDKFRMPRTSELRYNWVHAQLDLLDRAEAREIVLDAWRMVVPQRVAAALDESALS